MIMSSSTLHELTVASLEGLASALSENTGEDAEGNTVALRVYGDAIRLGIEAPKVVRTWAATPPYEHLDRALRSTDEQLRGQAYVPEDDASARAMLEDEAIENAFVERDWAESVLVAARRAMPAPDFQRSLGRASLTETLARFDARWRNVLSRETLFDLLGERAVLRPEYAFVYPLATSEGVEGELKGDPSAALDEELPSDDMIARYLAGGVFARTVEAAAARDADFAETLRAIYDAHAEAGEVTSLRAGAWRRAGRERTARSKAAVVVSVPPARAAASTSTVENENRWALLGRDETLGCAFELSLEVLGDSLVVHVDIAEKGKLAEVRVGDASVVVGPDDDHVELRVARRPELTLVVRSREGLQVEETLTFVAEDKTTP